MPRTLTLWALVVLVAALNVRMICYTHPAGRSAAAECNGTCPRKAPAPDENTTGCVLVAGGCAAMAAFGEALPAPMPVTFARPSVVIIAVPSDQNLYLPPSASPLSPPPKA